jgi:hypothetical protein
MWTMKVFVDHRGEDWTIASLTRAIDEITGKLW